MCSLIDLNAIMWHMAKIYFSYVFGLCLLVPGSQLLGPLEFPVIRAMKASFMLM